MEQGELVDFSDEEDLYPLISSPTPQPRRPNDDDVVDVDVDDDEDAGQAAGHQADIDEGELLRNLVQPVFEEDEDDAEEDQEYVSPYSSPRRSRLATRMKGVNLSIRARQSGTESGGKKSRTKRRRKRQESVAHAQSQSSTQADGAPHISEQLPTAVVPGAAVAVPSGLLLDDANIVRRERFDDGFEEENDEEDEEEVDEDEEAEAEEDASDDGGDESADDYDDDEDDADDAVEEMQEEFALLRSLYDQCCAVVGSGKSKSGADRLSLANGLRFGLGLGELADEVLVLQTPAVSWSVLKTLAALHRSRESISLLAEAALSRSQGGGGDSNESRRFPLPKEPPVLLRGEQDKASSELDQDTAVFVELTANISPPRQYQQDGQSSSTFPASASESPLSADAVEPADMAVEVPLHPSATPQKADPFLESLKKALTDSAERTSMALARAEEFKQAMPPLPLQQQQQQQQQAVVPRRGGGAPPKPEKPVRIAKPASTPVQRVAARARKDAAARELISPEFSEHFKPPPLSEYAERTGVILEGWLEKLSMSGIWQRRWFVLVESRTEYCILRVFGTAIKTAWGEIGSHPKASFPVVTLERIESRTASDPSASEREFRLLAGDCSHFHLHEHEPPGPASAATKGRIADSRELILRAESGAGRLMWVHFLRRAREAALEAYS